MDTILDKFGRVVIPKEIRDSLGLRPGSPLRIEENNQEIRITLIEDAPHLYNKNGWLVYTGQVSNEIFEAIDSVRRKRSRHVVRQGE